LKQSDLDAMTRNNRVSNIVAANGYVSGIGTIQYLSTSRDSTFMGVSEQYLNVEDTVVESGRFFTQDERKSLSRVVVLGSELKNQLFHFKDPIGKRIKIKGQDV